MAGKNGEVTFEIVEEIGEVSQRGNWWLEVNKVKWNNNEAKLDIRPWDETHEKMGKGITLTEDEARKIMEILQDYFADK